MRCADSRSGGVRRKIEGVPGADVPGSLWGKHQGVDPPGAYKGNSLPVLSPEIVKSHTLERHLL